MSLFDDLRERAKWALEQKADRARYESVDVRKNEGVIYLQGMLKNMQSDSDLKVHHVSHGEHGRPVIITPINTADYLWKNTARINKWHPKANPDGTYPRCSVEGCQRMAWVMGKCSKCYKQSWMEQKIASGDYEICSTDGCESIAICVGMCGPHYQRQLRAKKASEVCT